MFDASPPKKVNEDINGIDMMAPYRCFRCHSLCVEPKFLPECGHSLCYNCTMHRAPKVLNRTTVVITCPECNKESKVTGNAVGGWRESMVTNFQLKKIVQAVRQKEPWAVDREKDTDACPHLFFSNPSVLCPHCNKSFCQLCSIRHFERVRIEAVMLASELEDRWDSSVSWLEANSSLVQNQIEEEIKLAESDIEAITAELERKIKESIETSKQRLLQEARQIKDRKLGKLKDLMEVARNRPNMFADETRSLADANSLHCSPEQISKLFSNAIAVDKTITELELAQDPTVFIRTDVTSQVNVELITKEISANIATISAVDQHFSCDYPTTFWRMETFALDGLLDALRHSLEGMPPQCRKYVVEHRSKEDSNTLLLLAAQAGRTDIVEYLIVEQDADGTIRTTEDSSMPIHFAAVRGHLDTVKSLVKHFPQTASATNRFNYTPLGCASQGGRLEIVKFLVEEVGCDVNLPSKRFDFESDNNPIFIAAANNRPEIVRYLITKGSGISQKDFAENFVTVLHHAIWWDDVDLIKHLLELGPGLLDQAIRSCQGFPVHEAARCASINSLRLFVSEFAQNVNRLSSKASGATPIVIAVLDKQRYEGSRDVECVRFLIENGADINVRYSANGTDGQTLIHLAIAASRIEIVKYLLELKPESLQVKNGKGLTPLEFAKARLEKDISDLIESHISSK